MNTNNLRQRSGLFTVTEVARECDCSPNELFNMIARKAIIAPVHPHISGNRRYYTELEAKEIVKQLLK